jgi:microcystin-dependent protein
MPWTGSSGLQFFQRTDGTRTGAETWQEADAAGVDIITTDHDTHDQDMADGISSCLKNDGGNSATANIPMGGFRFTNLGQAISRTDSIRAGDVQNNRMSYCTVSGTANAITLTNTVPILTYAAGQEFRFQANLSNTGAVTVAVDGLAAKAVKVAGTALSAGQIVAGAWVIVAFDGTDFEMAVGTTPAAVSVGTVMAWPMPTVPAGWLECDGSAISRTTYAALFGVIGTSYGTGNGTSTFNLPNYKDEFLRGFDASGTDASSRTDRGDGSTGAKVGTKQADDYKRHNHTFTGTPVPDHTHDVNYRSAGGYNSDASHALLDPGTPNIIGGSAIVIQAAGGHTPAGTISNSPATGGTETRPKNVTVKWIILALPSAFVATAQVAPFFSRLTTDLTGTNGTAAQAAFASGQSSFTSPGSTSYEFDALIYITRAAGTTSHTTSFLFGGTATIGSILYAIESTTTTGAPTSTTNSQQLVATAATATVVATTSTSATENIVLKLKGTMTISDSGTVIPQFQYSAAPGGAPTVKAGSYIKFTPMGSDTDASFGLWS